MSLLVVGSVAFDGIETPFGKVEKTLGGAASYFALAASHFTPVRVVGIVGDDFTAREKAILGGRDKRIDLEGLEHASGKSFFRTARSTAHPCCSRSRIASSEYSRETWKARAR